MYSVCRAVVQLLEWVGGEDGVPGADSVLSCTVQLRLVYMLAKFHLLSKLLLKK